MAKWTKLLAAGATLFVVMGLAAGTASTAGLGAAAPAPASVSVVHAHAGFPDAAANSASDWTGWVDTACSTCHLRYVNANFTVPALDCSNSTLPIEGSQLVPIYFSAWVGLDGDGVSDLEQVGLYADCQSYANSGSNGPVYKSFYETVPDGPTFMAEPVSPGDSISVSVYYDQSTKDYSFYFSNNTQGMSETVPNIPCPTSSCGNKTAEVIAEVNYPGPPENLLPDFGTLTFSGTTVTSYDGTKGDLCGSSSDGLWTSAKVQASYEDLPLATASSLSTCSGTDGFTATYQRSI